MNFRTIVELPKYDFEINHSHKCLFLGSCFAENIGAELQKTKIPTIINPTGIHYNPISLANSIKQAININLLSSEDMFYANGLWNNYNFHSRFSKPDIQDSFKCINEAINYLHDYLNSLDYIFISFGSSYIYYNKSTNQPVSNCHKMPSSNFEKKLVKSSLLVPVWIDLINDLKKINSKLKIIFTLSPIRHLGDGLSYNQYSKSNLYITIMEILESFSASNFVYYFPAYELLLDDLRDYRFYDDDMLHPSSQAIQYIYNFFSSAFFSEETRQIIQQLTTIQKSLSHKPFCVTSDSYEKFLQSTQQLINNFRLKYPYIDLDDYAYI